MFLFSEMSRPALEPTQPPIQWKPGFFSPGNKFAEPSHAYTAKVKNEWSYPPSHHMPSHYME